MFWLKRLWPNTGLLLEPNPPLLSKELEVTEVDPLPKGEQIGWPKKEFVVGAWLKIFGVVLGCSNAVVVLRNAEELESWNPKGAALEPPNILFEPKGLAVVVEVVEALPNILSDLLLSERSLLKILDVWDTVSGFWPKIDVEFSDVDTCVGVLGVEVKGVEPLKILPLIVVWRAALPNIGSLLVMELPKILGAVVCGTKENAEVDDEDWDAVVDKGWSEVTDGGSDEVVDRACPNIEVVVVAVVEAGTDVVEVAVAVVVAWQNPTEVVEKEKIEGVGTAKVSEIVVEVTVPDVTAVENVKETGADSVAVTGVDVVTVVVETPELWTIREGLEKIEGEVVATASEDDAVNFDWTEVSTLVEGLVVVFNSTLNSGLHESETDSTSASSVSVLGLLVVTETLLNSGALDSVGKVKLNPVGLVVKEAVDLERLNCGADETSVGLVVISAVEFKIDEVEDPKTGIAGIWELPEDTTGLPKEKLVSALLCVEVDNGKNELVDELADELDEKLKVKGEVDVVITELLGLVQDTVGGFEVVAVGNEDPKLKVKVSPNFGTSVFVAGTPSEGFENPKVTVLSGFASSDFVGFTSKGLIGIVSKGLEAGLPNIKDSFLDSMFWVLVDPKTNPVQKGVDFVSVSFPILETIPVNDANGVFSALVLATGWIVTGALELFVTFSPPKTKVVLGVSTFWIEVIDFGSTVTSATGFIETVFFFSFGDKIMFSFSFAFCSGVLGFVFNIRFFSADFSNAKDRKKELPPMLVFTGRILIMSRSLRTSLRRACLSELIFFDLSRIICNWDFITSQFSDFKVWSSWLTFNWSRLSASFDNSVILKKSK